MVSIRIKNLISFDLLIISDPALSSLKRTQILNCVLGKYWNVSRVWRVNCTLYLKLGKVRWIRSIVIWHIFLLNKGEVIGGFIFNFFLNKVVMIEDDSALPPPHALKSVFIFFVDNDEFFT